MKAILKKIYNYFKKDNPCQCTHCVNYELYKWAVIMECPCLCHSDDGVTGHDSLCCEFPNGLRKNNPHKVLEKAEVYRKILNDWERDTDNKMMEEMKLIYNKENDRPNRSI